MFLIHDNGCYLALPDAIAGRLLVILSRNKVVKKDALPDLQIKHVTDGYALALIGKQRGKKQVLAAGTMPCF